MKRMHDEEPPLAPELMASLVDGKPDSALRERTLRAVREDGAFTGRVTLTAVPRRRYRAYAAQAAAALVIFAAGAAAGSWHARRVAAAAITSGTVATRIQVAAQAYVAALTLADADSGAGHAAALASLRAVAGQMARIVGDDRLGLAARYAMYDSARVSPVASQDKRGGLLWY